MFVAGKLGNSSLLLISGGGDGRACEGEWADEEDRDWSSAGAIITVEYRDLVCVSVRDDGGSSEDDDVLVAGRVGNSSLLLISGGTSGTFPRRTFANVF